MDTKTRAKKIHTILKKTYPARIALEFSNPLELLVATILSAQCTDKRVNIVTESLFKKYRTARSYAEAKQAMFEEEIYSTGFYRNKAKNIIAAAKRIVKNYGGNVPGTMKELLTLPGVARKTANIILWNAFGKNEGIPVDTHVIRVANRLGLTKHKDPVKIEKDMMPMIPRKDWGTFNLRIVTHGREICQARKPRCAVCPVGHLCPSRHLFM